MMEDWLWGGFYLMLLGFVLLMPNAFAPCTYPSFGKNTATIGVVVATIGGIIMIVSLLV